MICYFRHLGAIFKKVGLEVTRENKEAVDRILHTLVGVDYPNCPQTWKSVKSRISEDETTFVSELRDAWKKAETESRNG